MGADSRSSAAPGATEELRKPSACRTGGSKGSNSNGNSSGVLDVCSSISEYLAQLRAAAPSICPVPCGSFFTSQTALKDLTDCITIGGSCTSSSNSSSMAMDLFVAATQRQPEKDLRAFKAFAKTFHGAAAERLAGAKTCSVCGDIYQQQQQKNDDEEWGLCLLPHLDPSQQIKSFGLPQVACGRCLGVLWLSRLLAAAAANVSGDPKAQASGGRSLTAALDHFIAVNSSGEGPRGPLRFCLRGSSSKKRHQQQSTATDSSTFKNLPSEEQRRRALDVSIAAAFSVHLLAKEVPWNLQGPAESLEQIVEAVRASSVSAVPSGNAPGGALRPVKSEPQDALQSVSKRQMQHQPAEHQQRRPKKEKIGDPGTKKNEEMDIDAAKPHKTPKSTGERNVHLLSDGSTQKKKKLTKQKLQKRGGGKKTSSQ